MGGEPREQGHDVATAPSVTAMSGIGDLYREGMDTIGGCEDAAYLLFARIYRHHGIAEARRIFMKFGSAPTARKIAQIKNLGLLDRYDMMKPTPNVQRLARELAEENKTLPPRDRWGPRGTTNPATLDKHIRRLRDERDERRGWCAFPRR